MELNTIEAIRYYNATIFLNTLELIYFRAVRIILSWVFIAILVCVTCIKTILLFAVIPLIVVKCIMVRINKYQPIAYYRYTIRRIKLEYVDLFKVLGTISVEELLDKQSKVNYEISQNYLNLISGSMMLIIFSLIDWNVSKITNLSTKHLQIISDYKYLTG